MVKLLHHAEVHPHPLFIAKTASAVSLSMRLFGVYSIDRYGSFTR
jgi:F0F1-type ATP synthase membrane subunit a